MTSSGSATVLAPSSEAVLAACLVVDVADRDLHALGEEGFGGGAPDTPGGTGDRGCLSGEDAGLFGHLLLLGCGCPCAGRRAGCRARTGEQT